MALGDTISAITSLTDAASYYIQPNSGAEWVLHNIYHGGDIDIRWSNITLTASLLSVAGPNMETNLQAHLTNSIFIVLGCNSAQIVGYDGIAIK